MSVSEKVFPISGVCANCQRDRDDLFRHATDGELYCCDVFRCEARYEIQAERGGVSPVRQGTAMSDRGACDTCGQTFRLLASGKVPSHKSPWNTRYVCKGSNLTPERGSPSGKGRGDAR